MVGGATFARRSVEALGLVVGMVVTPAPAESAEEAEA